jgi:short-subunit dehydrogenase
LVSRTEAALQDAAKAIRAEHDVDVIIAAADLKHDEVARSLAERYGGVDILVNNPRPAWTPAISRVAPAMRRWKR